MTDPRGAHQVWVRLVAGIASLAAAGAAWIIVIVLLRDVL